MAEPYRVLVTGSRDWDDRKRIFGALDAILAQLETEPRATRQRMVVIHGDASNGADAIARRWVYVKRGATASDVREERHPANWNKHGRGAGFVRNAEMVEAGADMCLAYIRPCSQRGCRRTDSHGSHGGTHCADLAEKAGIDVRRFEDSP